MKHCTPPLSQNLKGTYEADIDILGVQMRWMFLQSKELV